MFVRYLAFVGAIGIMLILTMTNTVINDSCGCKTTVNLANPVIEQRDVGEGHVWDASILVHKITPKTERMPYDNLGVKILSPQGVDLEESVGFLRNDPSAYDDDADGVVIVQFWAIMNGHRPVITAEDVIVITGLGPEHQGATVYLYGWGEQIASITLPTVFEGT
jgi:hypothetical protein